MGSSDHGQLTGQQEVAAQPGGTIDVGRPRRPVTETVPQTTEWCHEVVPADDPTTLSPSGDRLDVPASADGLADADDVADEVAGLRQALTTRNIIGQAQGILIERHGADAEGAFEILVRMSQQTHLKLHEVARRLVDTTIAEKRAGE